MVTAGVLDAIAQVLPCDSAGLLRCEGDALVPIAIRGRIPEAARFAQNLRHRAVIRFDEHDHAWIAIAVRDHVLVIGAREPAVFEHISDHVLGGVAALAAGALRTEQIVHQLARDGDASSLIGHSAAMRAVCEAVDRAAASDRTVLITGETGVGKEVVAHVIHACSTRADAPLIRIDGTAATELAARLALADGGTLLLDEVAALPLALQAELVPFTGDVRIIATTNRDLADEVAAARFDAALFERLCAETIEVPPLRARRDDILLLAGYFLDQARLRLGLGPVRLTADARAALVVYDWPGNVRELEHALFGGALRAANGHRHEPVFVDAAALDLPAPAPAILQAVPPRHDGEPLTLDAAVDALKRQRIGDMVDRCHGNWAEAARRLGLDRGNLHRMARRLGMRS